MPHQRVIVTRPDSFNESQVELLDLLRRRKGWNKIGRRIQAARQLEQRRLVIIDDDRGCRLTDAGKAMAELLFVNRRHKQSVQQLQEATAECHRLRSEVTAQAAETAKLKREKLELLHMVHELSSMQIAQLEREILTDLP